MRGQILEDWTSARNPFYRPAEMWRAPVRALALALFDRDPPVPEDRVEWAIDDLSEFLAYAGPRTSAIFMLTVVIIEFLPLLIVGKFSRMSRLSRAERGEYLEAFDKTRLAILLVLPKALLSLVYFEHPDALRETGYDATCSMGQLPEGVGLVKLPLKRSA